jgi:hypothetical protein
MKVYACEPLIKRNSVFIYLRRKDMYRIIDKDTGKKMDYVYASMDGVTYSCDHNIQLVQDLYVIQRATMVYDKDGKELYEGDKLIFDNRYEWYRTTTIEVGTGYFNKDGKELTRPTFATREQIENDLEKYPYYEVVVELPKDYDWLTTSDIQSYYKIIGNILDKER